MSLVELLAAIVVAALLLAPALVATRRGSALSPIRAEVARAFFLRYCAAAAVAAILAGVGITVAAQTPSVILVGAANATLVAGPAYFWAGMRQLRSASMVPGWIAATAMLVTFATSSALFVALDGPTTGAMLRVVLVAVGCGAVAVEAARLPARGVPGLLAAGVLFLFYAAYSAARGWFWFTLGPESPAYRMWFSQASAALLSVSLTVCVCACVWLGQRELIAHAGRSQATAAHLQSLLATAGAVSIVHVHVPDLPLIRAAFGAPTAADIDRAVSMALHETAPELFRHDAPGSCRAAIAGASIDDTVHARIVAAASTAVPALDYREAIDIRVEWSVARSPEALAGLWADQITAYPTGGRSASWATAPVSPSASQS